ncbi:MAG: T9SS type A sorting domain-containing protein, partial [Flavobacteriales bacterium]|nr:T9SS type A sorting domain-containing protein [Flavobacteriales bacterium]
NDGDLDLMTGEQLGNFYYFENSGTNTDPVLTAMQNNPFGLTDIGKYSNPIFADLDNDGDLDLMSGEFTANFHYFENSGTNAVPVFTTIQIDPFGLTDIGNFSNPTFVDLDNDGDMDLMAGEYSGRFYYFENTTPVCTEVISSFSVSACESYTVPSGDETYTVSAMYMDTIPSLVTGCDSVMTIDVTINVLPDVGVTVTNPTLTANATSAAYQWLDCNDNDAIIQGATNQAYMALSNGSFAVEVTESGCTDTSACVSVFAVNINDVENEPFRVYPNPTPGQVNIEMSADVSGTLTLLDVTGKAVLSRKVNGSSLVLDLSELAKGIYTVQLIAEKKNVETYRILKQ